MQVPRELTELLAANYHGVELIYSMGRQRFALVQHTPRGAKVLRLLQDQNGGFVYPHHANTIGWLCAHDHYQMDTEWKKTAFLQGLDDHKADYDRRKREMLSDMVRRELAPPMLKVIRSGKLPSLGG